MIKNDKALSTEQIVFALDIGTRSIIGIVGVVEDDRLNVLAIEAEEHKKRSMIDGQIEDIDQVARTADVVKKKLETKIGVPLTRVSIAAAGRALITQKASYELELSEAKRIDEEIISQLEVGAISEAEKAFADKENPDKNREFFLVGYSVLSYYLDNYNMSTLKDHKGRNLKAEVIATFLPSEVVDSLYMAMNKIGLEVASVTLEPIAAINAAIPQELRLLNLVLVDIGAGTSDIAVCRDGGIVGYTMATLAGDEITETLMKQFLVDFNTAEKIKFQIEETENITFTDILGFEQTVKREEVLEYVQEPMRALCEEISKQILEVNGSVPSAVFLAGGGSKQTGLRNAIAEHLNMDMKRVAIAGNNFKMTAFSDEYDLENPEFATPLGIAVSAGLNLINDSFQVTLNGKPAKLFKNGVLKIMDVLMMNGYNYQHIVARSGQNILLQLNGKRKIVYGERSIPAVLKLNGKDAKVMDIIHAGDSIEFEPAVAGKNAEAVLSDVLEPYMGAALLNGMDCPADTPLQSGDIILTENGGSVEEMQQMQEQMMEAETEMPEDAAMEKTASPNSEMAQKKEPVVSEEHTEKKQLAASEKTGMETASAGKAEDKSGEPLMEQGSPEGQNDAETSGILAITLNEKSLRLPLKENGAPYYLMDILEYSDIDFDNISGNVVIKVNGQEGTFLQELNNYDAVNIQYEEK